MTQAFFGQLMGRSDVRLEKSTDASSKGDKKVNNRFDLIDPQP